MISRNLGSTLLLKFLKTSNLLEDDLVVVDVGCSGGLYDALREFEPKFRAIGIDPLVNEIQRLSQSETNPKVQYLDAWIISDRDPPQPARPDDRSGAWFERSSAASAQHAADRLQQKDAT